MRVLGGHAYVCVCREHVCACGVGGIIMDIIGSPFTMST